MFDSHFRTLFLSNPAHLRLESKQLIIELKDYPKSSLRASLENSRNEDTICHTERSEVSKSKNDKRDSSVASLPQNDKNIATQYNKEKMPKYDKRLLDTSLSTKAQYDKKRDISAFSKPQYDKEKIAQYDNEIDCHAKSSDFARNDTHPLALSAREGEQERSDFASERGNMDCHESRGDSRNDKEEKPIPLIHKGGGNICHTDREENTQHTPYKSDKHDKIAIPLSDIANIILESPQITLTSALLDALATHKVAVFSCDSSHLPSGIFMPFLGHYRSLGVLQSQIKLKNQTKAILWQQIIKSKIYNQSALLRLAKPNEMKTIQTLENLANEVNLGDSNNNEAQAAAVYFKALFGIDFARKRDGEIATNDINSTINAALNYGYAIVRGAIVRSIASSGLSPALGLFHANSFNPFNLADDIIEPFRAFVDSLVVDMLESGEFVESSVGLSLQNRVRLAQILSAQICVKTHTKANADKARNKGKLYPLMRAVVVSIQSVVNAIEANGRLDGLTLSLPAFVEDISNGREIYEGASDV